MEITNLAATAVPTAFAETAVVPTQPAGLSEASARFQALMGVDPTDTAGMQVASLNPMPNPDVFAPPPIATETLGDAILGSMRQMSDDFSMRWSQVHEMMQQDVTSMRDLLQMQLSLTQASVQYEVVGKAISKSTQNFDQLVRLQ